ncbi:MAG TPA: hypothetical protein VMT05_09895, partial [Terriglobales bacterium]|nr:hypothetical protein [Terriglobales bacterium]
GEVRLMTRYTQIGGDQTKSFYVPGENNLGEFNYFLDHHFLDTRRLQVLGMFRGTDDQSIDPTHNSLQKGYLRIYGPRDEYIFGDALVNFSYLSFNQNIRGADTSWKLGDSWKLTTVGGVYIDRWNSIWQDVPGRPYLASVAGSRLEYHINKRSTLGFNFSYSKDNVGTLPPPCDPTQPGQGACEIGAAPEPADNKVGSVDLKLQFPWGLRMNAEYAYSLTDFDIRQPVTGLLPQPCDPNNPVGPCYTPCPQIDTRAPVPGCGTQGDWGVRAEATYRWHKLTLRGSFARYQPNFTSVNARQINDLQDGIFRATYDLTHFLTLDGTVRRNNNNLRGQLTATPTGYESVLWGPEMHFILHDLGFYRRAILEFGYRDRELHGTRPMLANCIPTLPAIKASTCVDQSVRMPFGELSIPYHTTYLTVGYEMRGLVDNIDPAQSQHVHRAYAALRGLYELRGWHINPNFRFELERTSQRPNQGLAPCEPALGLADPCLLTYDTNRLDTAALLAEAPRWFILELGYRTTTATIFGPSGYRRPSYRAALTYKIRNDENTVLIFSFLRNNYFFLTPPNLTPITDYDERQMGVTFVYKFGKRR